MLYFTFAFLAPLLLVSAISADMVDLSLDLATAPLDTPGAEAIMAIGAALPDIRTLLVLEHGKIVANYVRNDVDPDSPFQVWSITKSWIGLLIGIMVEDGLIGVEETLGDIFTDESAWSMTAKADLDFKKNVKIQELLTMTSGLVWYPPFDPVSTANGGDAGGASLAGALALPTTVGEKGVFSYLSSSNILSYVIRERTGISPREYASLNVFPFLGMDDVEVGWWQNDDGIEYGYHGLELTSRQMAKFGLLYQQGGRVSASNETPILSPTWITTSISPLVEAQSDGIIGAYGQLFWLFNGLYLGFPNTGEFYCAFGQGGQFICMHPELDRILVQQSDFEPLSESFIMPGIAFDKTVSFTESSSTPNAGSTATRLSGSMAFGGAVLVCLWASFVL